ncbi:hypothetical protein YC2023_106710 [Brassica napus]
MVDWDYDNPWKQLDHMAENNEGTKLFGELDWVLWKGILSLAELSFPSHGNHFQPSCYNSSRVSPHGLEHNQPKDFNIDIVKTVVVGQSGATDFKTIQEAIDSVPSGNNNWIKIQLQNGIYLIKQVEFTSVRVLMQRKDSDSAGETKDNTAGKQPIRSKGSSINCTNGGQAWFYGCSFISVQDTLADFVGRRYFKNCYIEGAIDFIWGGGQSIYEKCVIYVKGMTKDEMVEGGAMLPGFITAQGRQSEQDTSGFVFKYCAIKGDGTAFLGRAYRGYSRVVFYATSMSKMSLFLKDGMLGLIKAKSTDKITFAEVNCTGEGANKQGRAAWQKNLSATDVDFLVNPNTFIDRDSWIFTLPYSLLIKLNRVNNGRGEMDWVILTYSDFRDTSHCSCVKIKRLKS